MALRIVWSTLAKNRLREAVLQIRAHNPEAAKRFRKETLDAVRSLREFPELGRILPELERPEIRELVVGKGRYRLVYELSEEVIDVLTLFHTSQDPDKLFWELT